MVAKRRAVVKNPPYLSHEFVIQNYGDLLASLALLIVMGLLFNVSQPISSLFVSLSHNVTIDTSTMMPTDSPGMVPDARLLTLFTPGLIDFAALFFYTLIWLVLHQVWQEYTLDRFCRRLHLSKTRTTLFNESGQLAAFAAISVVWAVYLLVTQAPALLVDRSSTIMTAVSVLWDNYPHHYMSVGVKLFYLAQLAYWIHSIAGFYFQRLKSNEMTSQLSYIVPHIALISAAYVLCLNRLGLVLLTLNYLTLGLYHGTRLISYALFRTDEAEADESAGQWALLSRTYILVFPLARLVTICLSFLVLWTGMAQQAAKYPSSSSLLSATNFFIRTTCFAVICVVQFTQMWNYINEQIRNMRRKPAVSKSKTTSTGRTSQFERAKARREAQRINRLNNAAEKAQKVD